jgi:hypothetical protein
VKAAGSPGLLDKARTVAGPGYNRWLVPPAALCIHLCIGMAYGFSVFWLPLTRAVGIEAPVTCPAEMGLLAKLTTTSCDWDKPLLGWMYTLFFVFLGSSAAVCGSWLEATGPRSVGVWETLLVLAAMYFVVMMIGGFAAIPAYLADLFGTGSVGAIHGRLLTAWSVAGILGPVVFNSLNEAQLRAGLPRAQAYDRTMLVLAMLLLVGFLCNLLVRPVVIRPRAS